MQRKIFISTTEMAMYSELVSQKPTEPINYDEVDEIVETWIADFDDGYYVDINVCVGECGNYWCEAILMKTYADTSGHDVDSICGRHQLDGIWELHADGKDFTVIVVEEQGGQAV